MHKARKVVATLVLLPGVLVMLATVFYCVGVGLRLADAWAGFWGIFIGLVLLPVTGIGGPIYVLATEGRWFPLAVLLGGPFVSGFLFGAANLIRGDDDWSGGGMHCIISP